MQKISSLIKLYINCNNITNDAADDIAAVISYNTRLQVLDLGSNDLQASGITKISKSLQKISSLIKLYINHNNITNDAADDIAAVISYNTHLQVLDLGSSNLQASGITKILRSLQKISSLLKLFINHNNITDEAADDIAAVISYNTYLQELDLGSNDLRASGITKISRSLQKISSLIKLYINRNNITHEAADDIAAVISYNTHLQELHLGSNDLRASGITKISRSLQKISSLIKLYINHNNITHEAADDIAAVVSYNTHIQELDLGSNDLRASGITKISRSLQKISSLIKLYINHNNITNEAADDIAAVISCNTHLQELDLGSNDLRASGITKISRSLQKISSLIKFFVNHNNITNEAADDIATVISCNSHLQELHLGNNKLQASGITKVLRSLQKISSLTKLYINHNNITNEAADDIATVVSCNAHLQELHLGSNDFQASGITKVLRSLQKISSLLKLCINHSNITDKAADDIAAVISCNTHLQELDLASNDLRALGITKISRSLQTISSLIKLCINHNNITDKAADDIAAVISCNTHLQELDLASNDLRASGITKISKSLQKISSLIKLHVNHNNITNEAADDIAAVISCNTYLQELDLGSNDLRASGITKISRSLQKTLLIKLYINHNNITDEAADDIATVISCNTHLQELDLSNNDLRTSGITKVLRSLQKISSLIKLCINHNKITDKAADDIAAVVSCNTHLQELNISRNDLRISGITIILRSLQKISSLIKLYINHNNITNEAADDIAAVISCNTHLQELNISRNDLRISGITKILRSLQKISLLTKLYINHNIITNEAADDIAAVILSNSNLEEFDIGSSNLQTVGAIQITKALQKISSLKTFYISNNYITDVLANDIAAVISCNKIQELDVSENNLKMAGVKMLARALQNISTLTNLSLSNNKITNEAADEIAAAITCNTHLQELDLGSNDLRASGITKISVSLQKISSLIKLYINHNNIKNKAADDIAAAISCNIYLQEFSIGTNHLRSVGAIKIAKGVQNISTLTKFCICENNITQDAADDIAYSISHNTQMEELDVSRNNLQAMGVIKIAKTLQHICTLKKLNIRYNNITNEAANDIAAVITCNTQMEEFDVSGNDLQTKGIMKIAKSLQNICTLKKLYISKNNITEEGANDIAAVISCNKIQELDVSNNSLKTTGVRKLARALQNISTLTNLNISNNNVTDETADDIAAAISCNPYLEEFDIGVNKIQERGAIKLAKSFQQISTLRKLYIDYNMITDEAADDFVAVIHHNSHLKEFRYNGNKFKNVTFGR